MGQAKTGKCDPYNEEKKQVRETTCEREQDVTNLTKKIAKYSLKAYSQKKSMIKEVKEGMTIVLHLVKNTSKEIKIIKEN